MATDTPEATDAEGRATIPETERDALSVLVRSSRISRVSVARILGLTPQAVSQIVDRLIARGIDIEQSDQATGRGGQPARIYELRAPKRACAIAIDIGYHDTRVALCKSDGEVLTAAPRIPLGLLQPDPAVVFNAAKVAIVALTADRKLDDIVGIGIAVAGPVDPAEKMLRSGPTEGRWEASDFAKEFAERFPDTPNWRVEVDNDANLAAAAEHRSGVAVGVQTVVHVRWTVGIGCGLILNGELFTGGRGIAGELGHVVFPPEATDRLRHARCPWCGHACLQSLAGTDAIVDGAKKAKGLQTTEEGGRAPIGSVIAAAHEGDPEAKKAIVRAAHYVGKMLAIVADLLNPELIVIGGAFGRGDYDLVVPTIQAAMSETTIQPAFKDARIVMGTHSGAAGGGATLRGAATRLFDRHLSAWLLRELEDGELRPLQSGGPPR